MTDLTILQWNIHGLVSKAVSLLQYINTHDTPIILLQETLVGDASTLRLGRQYQLFHQPSAPGGSRGLITLVRKDLPATLKQAPCHLGDLVDSLCVTLHLGGDGTLDVYNVYCRQRAQLNLLPLLEDGGGRPALLSGDFNAHHPLLEPWGGGVINQRGRHLTHVLEEFPALILHGTPQPTHIAGGRLDLTLTAHGSGQPLPVRLVPELLSDHWAQESTLRVTAQEQAAPPPRKRWATSKANWQLFTAHLDAWYAAYRVPDSVQLFNDDLTAAIQAAADASMPTHAGRKHNPNKKHLWFYDDRVQLLTRMTRRLTKTFRATRQEEDRTNLREWAAYARQQVKLIREEKWLHYMGQLNNNTNLTRVWQQINTVRGKHTRPAAHPDPAGRAEQLMQEYHDRAATTNLPERLRERKAAMDPVRQATVSAATLLADDTDAEITREEMLRARKASKDTAPGDDGLTYTMLNNVCHVAGDPLLRLFNMSFAQGVLPEAWVKANIVPIPKPHEIDKYRPISLTPVICKMLERVLLHRLHYKMGTLDPGVNGFVRHRSSANCLANYVANAQAKTAVFIDIEKAFDRAQPLVILEELTRLGVKGRLLQWIQSYLTGRKARVIFQGAESTYHTLENGTPQGGVLSPTLFNVLMNVLATLPYPAGTQHLGYADDVVLQTTGRDAVERMQESLDLLATKCEDIGFTMSESKTKAMAKTRHTPLIKLQLQGQDLEWVATHRYLGVIVSRTNSTKAEVQHLREKCRLRNRVIRAMSWKGMGASGAVLLAAYKSLVRTLIDYASPVLTTISSSDAKALESIQNDALRIVFGAPKWTRTDNLRAEARLPSLFERVKYMTATLAVKASIRASHPDFVYTALHRYHEVGRGQGKWIESAAASIRDLGVPWDTIVAASIVPAAQRPPWTELPITTLIQPLRSRKRDSVTAALRQQGLQSIHEARRPDTVEYFTDGSADPQGGRCGAAFVCTAKAGAEQLPPAPPVASAVRLTDYSSSTQAELTAIQIALRHAHTSHNHNVLIHTDSMAAITSLHAQHCENSQLLDGIITTAAAIQDMGRLVTVNWIPSHVGISGNEAADALAQQGAQALEVQFHVPYTLRQLKGRLQRQAEARRLQRVREDQRGDSVSARWLGGLQPGPSLREIAVSRRCEVVRSRIRLGYLYNWQVGIATTEAERRCRLCAAPDSHTLEHYLRDCILVHDLRVQCPVPTPTLTDLANHFLNILPDTLAKYSAFCAAGAGTL